jgi:hypothetical protein
VEGIPEGLIPKFGKSMSEHYLFFIPENAKERKSWRGFPPAASVCSGDSCTVELPQAPDKGSWKIECKHCAAWALVNVEKSVSDPKSFTMPCGRVKIWSDEDLKTSTP